MPSFSQMGVLITLLIKSPISNENKTVSSPRFFIEPLDAINCAPIERIKTIGNEIKIDFILFPMNQAPTLAKNKKYRKVSNNLTEFPLVNTSVLSTVHPLHPSFGPNFGISGKKFVAAFSKISDSPMITAAQSSLSL